MRYLSILSIYFCLQASIVLAEDGRAVSFRSQIAPILLDHCLACHGPKKAEGGYRVDTYDELRKAGDSGALPIAKSTNEISELLRRVSCDDESERMPADDEPLSLEQISLIELWIAAGGVFDGEDSGESLSTVIPPAHYVDPPEEYRRPLPVTAITFSPDGQFVITGGYYEVLVWNSDDGSLARRIKNIGQRVFALAFSPNGKTLAVGCGQPGHSGEVRLIDFLSGEILGVVARTSDVVLDVAFRPGTNELAVASADSLIRIVDTASFDELNSLACHADWINAVSWSDDGALLASASRDKSVKVVSGVTGELVASYPGHAAAVHGVSFLADGKQIISVGSDQKLHRWQLEGAKKLAEIKIGAEGFRISRMGEDAFVPCSDKRLLRIDLSKNSISQEYLGHNDWVLSAQSRTIEMDAESALQIVSGSFDGEVRIWNANDAALVRQWIAKP